MLDQNVECLKESHVQMMKRKEKIALLSSGFKGVVSTVVARCCITVDDKLSWTLHLFIQTMVFYKMYTSQYQKDLALLLEPSIGLGLFNYVQHTLHHVGYVLSLQVKQKSPYYFRRKTLECRISLCYIWATASCSPRGYVYNTWMED